jgi:hypothetical protein
MSPLDGERRFTSAITRGPSGPRRTATRNPRAGGSSAAAARTAPRGSRRARRSASDLASATARARNEPVEVTAVDSSRSARCSVPLGAPAPGAVDSPEHPRAGSATLPHRGPARGSGRCRTARGLPPLRTAPHPFRRQPVRDGAPGAGRVATRCTPSNQPSSDPARARSTTAWAHGRSRLRRGRLGGRAGRPAGRRHGGRRSNGQPASARPPPSISPGGGWGADGEAERPGDGRWRRELGGRAG